MKVAFLGHGLSLPRRRVRNRTIASLPDPPTSHQWIVDHTGVWCRRYADMSERNSDFATRAALRALRSSGIPASRIGAIILATVTPDYPSPSTASIVQERIRALGAAAWDINAGCSGFVYGVINGKALIENGTIDYALVIGSDLLSRLGDFNDRRSFPLFGDGAGAVVLGRSPNKYGIDSTMWGADPDVNDKLIVPDGGTAAGLPYKSLKIDEANIPHGKVELYTPPNRPLRNKLEMKGTKVFEFAISKLPEVVEELAKRAKVKVGSIDQLFPHQANGRITQSAAERLGLTEEQVYDCIAQYGNTSAASIPIAMSEWAKICAKRDIPTMGLRIGLAGFGAGGTFGGVLARWAS